MSAVFSTLGFFLLLWLFFKYVRAQKKSDASVVEDTVENAIMNKPRVGKVCNATANFQIIWLNFND